MFNFRDQKRSFRALQLLQCCSSKIDCTIVKINSIFIYKYRSIFRVWKIPLENCNTATVQRPLDACVIASLVEELNQKK